MTSEASNFANSLPRQKPSPVLRPWHQYRRTQCRSFELLKPEKLSPDIEPLRKSWRARQGKRIAQDPVGGGCFFGDLLFVIKGREREFAVYNSGDASPVTAHAAAQRMPAGHLRGRRLLGLHGGHSRAPGPGTPSARPEPGARTTVVARTDAQILWRWSSFLPMTMRWISEVPSPIRSSGASR